MPRDGACPWCKWGPLTPLPMVPSGPRPHIGTSAVYFTCLLLLDWLGCACLGESDWLVKQVKQRMQHENAEPRWAARRSSGTGQSSWAQRSGIWSVAEGGLLFFVLHLSLSNGGGLCGDADADAYAYAAQDTGRHGWSSVGHALLASFFFFPWSRMDYSLGTVARKLAARQNNRRD